MYKKTDPSDTEKLKERDEEIAKVKKEMDVQKQQKIEEAKLPQFVEQKTN